jgi:hypothetical protein
VGAEPVIHAGDLCCCLKRSTLWGLKTYRLGLTCGFCLTGRLVLA